MAQDRFSDKTAQIDGEYRRKDTTPAKEESLNTYYTRKQRGVQSRLATDDDVYLWDANQDRDAEADSSDVRDKDGFTNYKRWDRYGR